MWKDQGHPLRQDPELQLTGIPTLIHWGSEGKQEVLGKELEAAQSEQEADSLIAQFIATTK